MAGVSVAEVAVQGEPSTVWSHPHQLLLGGDGSPLLQEVRGWTSGGQLSTNSGESVKDAVRWCSGERWLLFELNNNVLVVWNCLWPVLGY